jgi:outer membrane protein assembly factor BamB
MMLEERARRAAEGVRHGVELMPARAVAAAPGTYEAFLRFETRRRRNERITAIAVASILVVAAFAAALGLLRSATRQRPADTVITPQEVGSLELEWSVGSGDPNASYSAAVAGDQVLVTRKLGEPTGRHQMSGTRGEVSAYPVNCQDPCSPTWKATTERPILRMTVADDVAYVAERATGEPGALLYAFAADCGSGGAECEPLWTGRIGAGAKWNVLPLVTGGKVLVASSDGLFAFDVGCGTNGDRCEPVWVAHPSGAAAKPGSAIMASTTSGDTVYVASPEVIAAYPVDCEGECSPLWSRPAPQPAQWLALWDDTLMVGSMVTGRQGTGEANHVWALPADCPDTRGCDVLWSIETEGLTPVSVAGDVLYVIDQVNDLVAHEQPCDESGCRVRWRARKPLTQQIAAEPALVVDGVVYISSWNGYVLAYPVDCERDCEAIWQTSQAGYGYTYVTVGAGKVFAGSDGIYAFGVPAADLGGDGTSGWPGAALPIVPIVVVALAAAWLLVRLRRRRPA